MTDRLNKLTVHFSQLYFNKTLRHYIFVDMTKIIKNKLFGYLLAKFELIVKKSQSNINILYWTFKLKYIRNFEISRKFCSLAHRKLNLCLVF